MQTLRKTAVKIALATGGTANSYTLVVPRSWKGAWRLFGSIDGGKDALCSIRIIPLQPLSQIFSFSFFNYI